MSLRRAALAIIVIFLYSSIFGCKTILRTGEASTAPDYGTSVVDIQYWEAITGTDLSFTQTEIKLRVDVGIFHDNYLYYVKGEYVNAWVDWDGNKVFEPEEQIMDEFEAPIKNKTVIPNLTFEVVKPIPQVGGKLPIYMRVALGYSYDPKPVDTWSYGSVKDVLILGAEIIEIK